MATYEATTDKLLQNGRDAFIEARGFTRTISTRVRDQNQYPGPQAIQKQDLEYSPAATPPRQTPSFSDLFDGVDRTNEIVQRVDQQLDQWIQDYFPTIYGQFKSLPEDTMVQLLAGVEGAYVSQRFAQTFTRARDRAYRTAMSAKESAKADFTGRGFDVPQGVVAHAMNQADQQFHDVMAQVNVDILVQDAQLRSELLQFAVQQANQHKQAMLQLALEFARSWITLPDQELERAKVKAQAQSALYQALSAYYQVEVAFEQIRLSAASEQLRSDTTLEQAAAVERNANDNAASALGDAVNGLSSIAASAYSAAGTLVAQIEST